MHLGTLYFGMHAITHHKRRLFFLTITSLLIVATTSRSLALTAKVPKSKTDLEISNRIEKILAATEWFPKLDLEVKEGLVFLKGNVDTPERLEWAKNIIEGTEGVVAVVEDLEQRKSVSDSLDPVQDEVNSIIQKGYRILPYLISAILILLVFCAFAFLTNRLIKNILMRRHRTLLVSMAVANISAIVVILLGVYFALRTSGLSGLAFTVLGGTGVIGLGIGLALKSSLENYASGLMISLREVFRRGEIVAIDNVEGIVQSVTTRGTTIMDYEGNNITFPNSLIMNTTIKNMTRNPNMRTDFQVGIGYDDSIDHAREVILAVLSELPEQILKDPEALVTTDELGPATVNLKVYFWFDGIKYSKLKIRSLVVQRVKEALMKAQISLPDDAREVVFKTPLQIIDMNVEKSKQTLLEASNQKSEKLDEQKSNTPNAPDLKNEIVQIRRQAEQTNMNTTKKGEDILK